jgi:hypothetical protein
VTKIINQIIAEVENGAFGMELKPAHKGWINPGGVELIALNAQLLYKVEIPE